MTLSSLLGHAAERPATAAHDAQPEEARQLREHANRCLEAQDIAGYEEACRRVLQHSPHDPQAMLALAGAMLHNVRPASALGQLQAFLERWPRSPHVAAARETVAELQRALPGYLADLGLQGPEGAGWAARYEEATWLLERGHAEGALALYEQIIEHNSGCVAAYNNATSAHYQLGHPELAIAMTQRALETDPSSYHALANLVIFLAAEDRLNEARDVAARLRGITDPSPDCWARKAQALAAVGDYDQARRALERVRKAGIDPADLPTLAHLDAELR